MRLKRPGFRSASQPGESEYAQEVQSGAACPCRAHGLRPPGTRRWRTIGGDPCCRAPTRRWHGDAEDLVQPLRASRALGQPRGVSRGGEPQTASRARRVLAGQRDFEGCLSVFCQGTGTPQDEMVAFIDRQRDHVGDEAIRRVVGATERGFLTSRGYHAAKQRPASARAVRDEVLVEEIRRIHAENYGVYGYRKMHHAMRRAGWEVGRDQTARLMKAAGLCGIRRGRKVFTTSPAGGLDRRPDLVERNFTAAGPNQLWV